MDKDSKFKVSLDKSDSRYWDIYKDFVNVEYKKYKDGKFDVDSYYQNIHEHDAYLYEYEYYISNLAEFTKTAARNEILVSLIESAYVNANLVNQSK